MEPRRQAPLAPWVEGAAFTVKGREITIKTVIPAHGHRLAKVKSL